MFATVQSVSIMQSPGSVEHAPQPCGDPGTTQVSPGPVHCSCVEQHDAPGQPSCGHSSGVAPSAKQPRYARLQKHVLQMSGAHPSVARQSASASPLHGGDEPPPPHPISSSVNPYPIGTGRVDRALHRRDLSSLREQYPEELLECMCWR